jgi:methyl-accepting chemotaxis protein
MNISFGKNAPEKKKPPKVLEANIEAIVANIAHKAGGVGGIETEDSPYIAMVVETSSQIGHLFEQAIASRSISAADLFDQQYRPIPGSDPAQFIARFTAFADQVLPDILEKAFTFLPKIAYIVAADRNGYVPTHNRKYSKSQTNDPIWNKANCRNHRMFNNGRTELSAVHNQGKFLLQTYRRDMGGGNFVLMKDLSAPIWVNGKHWGAVRAGYQF